MSAGVDAGLHLPPQENPQLRSKDSGMCRAQRNCSNPCTNLSCSPEYPGWRGRIFGVAGSQRRRHGPLRAPKLRTLDDQVGARRHRLQLRHRARARRAQSAARRAARFDLQFHGHRRDGESGDGAFPIAHRAVARQRPRAELRIRPARAREAAAQVRRPRRDAGAHAHEDGTHATRKK